MQKTHKKGQHQIIRKNNNIRLVLLMKKHWNTISGYQIIRVLSRRSNTYLIHKDNFVLLVEKGEKSSYKTLFRNIEFLKTTSDDISFLILTHTHFDHCQSAKKLKEKRNCKIIVSSLAEESIRNGYTKLPNGTFFITKLISGFDLLIGKRKYGYEPFYPDSLISNKYDLNSIGHLINIIETPGHSNDSISKLADNEVAIVEDAMFGFFNISIYPSYADNIDKTIEIWGKLLNTGCKIFLPGHWSEISLQLLQKEYDKYNLKGIICN